MAKTCVFGMTMAIAAADHSAAADDSVSLLQRFSIVRHRADRTASSQGESQGDWLNDLDVTEDDSVSPLQPEFVVNQMRNFEDAYNDDVMQTEVTSFYAPQCNVTVNGGVDQGGPFTGRNSSAVAGFLGYLRNTLNGTNMKFAVTKVNASVHEAVHDDVWVADNGAGACKATWQQIQGKWMIVKDEISFTPMVALQPNVNPAGVPPEWVVNQMRVFEERYNANDMMRAASLYHQECNVTVNDGNPLTNRSAVAGFLGDLRNSMGGTNIRFAVTNVYGPVHEDAWVHEDVWVADNGAGACKATWKQIEGNWMIVKDEISFTPMVAIPQPFVLGLNSAWMNNTDCADAFKVLDRDACQAAADALEIGSRVLWGDNTDNSHGPSGCVLQKGPNRVWWHNNDNCGKRNGGRCNYYRRVCSKQAASH